MEDDPAAAARLTLDFSTLSLDPELHFRLDAALAEIQSADGIDMAEVVLPLVMAIENVALVCALAKRMSMQRQGRQ